jgi:hypothetical protein
MKQDELDGCQATDERQRKRGRSSFSYIASLFSHSLTPPRYFKFAGVTQHYEKWEIKERSTHKMSSQFCRLSFGSRRKEEQ